MGVELGYDCQVLTQEMTWKVYETENKTLVVIP